MSQQRTIRVVAAVLEKDGRYLITQRRATAVLPLMWEFPGGRVEDGEIDAHAPLPARCGTGSAPRIGRASSSLS